MAIPTPSADADALYGDLLGRATGDSAQIRALGQAPPCPYETGWEAWLTHILPEPLRGKATGELVPFGPHHVDFWDWVWALHLGAMVAPLVCIWPRGGGKSTGAELAGAMVGALQKRRYVLYICDTLERAEDHVDHVAELLSSPMVARYYPHASEPMVGKTGAVKGWRRNRLRTAGGFTVDALGLDVAARGVKLGHERPDLMILDDLDTESDGPAVTESKIRKLARKFLPAGSSDLAVLAVQNLVIRDGIFSRLAGVSEHAADMLHGRTLSGPFRAVEDLAWERTERGTYRITCGQPIWAGQDLAVCESQMNRYGVRAFLSESQQDVTSVDGGMFDVIDFDRITVRQDAVPPLMEIACWVDPAVSESDTSDSHGIQIDGRGQDGKLYRLWSWERRASPNEVLTLAITKAIEYGATTVGIETDQGGDTWRDLYAAVCDRLRREGEIPAGVRIPSFASEKAGSSQKSKAERASKMLLSYEQDEIRHVYGTHHVLERALKRFLLVKPFDLTDAAYWSWYDLIGRHRLPTRAKPLSQTRPSRWRT